MKKRLMPRGGEITREELTNAIFSHLSVIMPRDFDDEDLAVFTSACLDVVENSINYGRTKAKPVLGSKERRETAQQRAQRGGMPPIEPEAHLAIDGMIRLYEIMAQNMMDTPEFTPVVNEFLRLSKIAKAWIDRESLPPTDDKPTINWMPVTEQMPTPERPVLVACAAEGQYTISYWSRAVWVPRFSHEAFSDDYEGDLDYKEKDGEGYWPEGWYEWNNHEDVHWQLPTSVTHWAEVELPATEQRA